MKIVVIFCASYALCNLILHDSVQIVIFIVKYFHFAVYTTRCGEIKIIITE